MLNVNIHLEISEVSERSSTHWRMISQLPMPCLPFPLNLLAYLIASHIHIHLIKTKQAG